MKTNRIPPLELYDLARRKLGDHQAVREGGRMNLYGIRIYESTPQKLH